MDLSRYIDRNKKVSARSPASSCGITGGAFAPSTFPARKAPPGCSTRPARFSCAMSRSAPTNSYATVIVISLDGEPLVRTGRALVQVGTRARPTGWSDHTLTFKVNDGKQTVSGRQIDDTGRMPWVIDATKVTITVRNSNLASATLLDINGNARSRVPVRRVENAIEVELPTDAIYVVLGGK